MRYGLNILLYLLLVFCFLQILNRLPVYRYFYIICQYNASHTNYKVTIQFLVNMYSFLIEYVTEI